jgi:hypothetical protein
MLFVASLYNVYIHVLNLLGKEKTSLWKFFTSSSLSLLDIHELLALLFSINKCHTG